MPANNHHFALKPRDELQLFQGFRGSKTSKWGTSGRGETYTPGSYYEITFLGSLWHPGSQRTAGHPPNS